MYALKRQREKVNNTNKQTNGILKIQLFKIESDESGSF